MLGVLREAKSDGLLVDPQAIAVSKEIFVQPKPDTVEGVSGMLVKVGDEFEILYATSIPSKGFQRFSVAHEIGHYCIDGHVYALLTDGVHYSHAGFRSSDPYEQEADFFAAALLMPERPFRNAIDDHPVGLEGIEALSMACKTSLISCAIRYSGLTRDGVAVILSTGATVDWCFMSDGMKDAKGRKWLRKGTPLPPGTVTEGFNNKPDTIRAGHRDAATEISAIGSTQSGATRLRKRLSDLANTVSVDRADVQKSEHARGGSWRRGRRGSAGRKLDAKIQALGARGIARVIWLGHRLPAQFPYRRHASRRRGSWTGFCLSA